MLTTTEAAALLGTARLNVQKWCQHHKVKKFGRGYAITPKVLERMRQSLTSLPGDRPRRGRPSNERTRG